MFVVYLNPAAHAGQCLLAPTRVLHRNNWGWLGHPTKDTLQKRSVNDHPRRCPNADWLYRQNTHPLVSGHRGSRGWCDTHAPRHGRSRNRRSKALLLTTRRLASPVPEDAHFVGTATFDLYGTFTVHIHHAVPRCAARSTAALRNDGVENVAALTLVEHHGLNAIHSETIEIRDQGYGGYGLNLKHTRPAGCVGGEFQEGPGVDGSS